MTGEGGKPLDAGGLDSIGELVRSSLPAMSAEQEARGLARISMRMSSDRARPSRAPRIVWAGLATACLSAVGVWLVVHRGPVAPKPGPLTFQVSQGAVVEGGYLHSQLDSGVVVTFSEGTTLAFARGARGRLRTVDTHGARIALEQGAVDVAVVKREAARWMVDAGPFLIHVQGTVFNVSWDAQSEFLELRMQQGRVQVTGPISDGAISVRGGQRLSISVPKRAVILEDTESSATTKQDPVAEMAGSATSRHPGPGSRPRPMTLGPFRWGAALAAGDLDGILNDVEKYGLSRCLAAASSEDLAALSDAARYRKKHEISRKALLAQRERFADSERAHDAAFHLGRLSEANYSDGTAAIDWYDRYLSESPSGAYVSEALGRKMTSLAQLEGNPAAAKVAEEYLRRFPQGTYAGAANAIRKSR